MYQPGFISRSVKNEQDINTVKANIKLLYQNIEPGISKDTNLRLERLYMSLCNLLREKNTLEYDCAYSMLSFISNKDNCKNLRNYLIKIDEEITEIDLEKKFHPDHDFNMQDIYNRAREDIDFIIFYLKSLQYEDSNIYTKFLQNSLFVIAQRVGLIKFSPQEAAASSSTPDTDDKSGCLIL